LATDLDLPWLYQQLLGSPEASRSIASGAMIRDPIDLMIASLNQLGSRHPDALRLAREHLARMQQAPFRPPNVKGWPVDTEWLTLRSLRARQRGLQVLLSDSEVWESRRLDSPLSPGWLPRPPLGLTLPAPPDQEHLAALWNDPVWQLK
jgi:uncharacterized protein (DUF1800 family)